MRSSFCRLAPILRVMGSEPPSGPALELSEDMRVAVLENLSDGVYFVDRQRRILYWNKGAERITGFSKEEVIGRRCRDNILNHCDEAGTELCGAHCPLLATIRDGRQRETHLYLHHKDGHRKPVQVRAAAIRDAAGKIVGAVETFYDDSTLIDTRRRAVELERASMCDPLTGVGNRRLGESTIGGCLEQYRTFGRSFGIVFADIDSFKLVNDRFGHEVGDLALKVVARTLADTSRAEDQVIRWGGEEFLVAVSDVDLPTLARIAGRLRVLVERTRLIAERRHVPLTISIGATLAAPGDTTELIIRRADALLYRSKAAGRNRVTLDE